MAWASWRSKGVAAELLPSGVPCSAGRPPAAGGTGGHDPGRTGMADGARWLNASNRTGLPRAIGASLALHACGLGARICSEPLGRA